MRTARVSLRAVPRALARTRTPIRGHNSRIDACMCIHRRPKVIVSDGTASHRKRRNRAKNTATFFEWVVAHEPPTRRATAPRTYAIRVNAPHRAFASHCRFGVNATARFASNHSLIGGAHALRCWCHPVGVKARCRALPIVSENQRSRAGWRVLLRWQRAPREPARSRHKRAPDQSTRRGLRLAQWSR